MLQQLTGINAIMFCECGSLDAWLARRLAAAGAAAVALHSELAHRVMHAPLLTPASPPLHPPTHDPTHADAPAIFSSLGSGRSGSLMNTVIIGAVNVVSTFVSIFSVDRFGRRGLFLEGGVQMILGQVVAGIMLAVEFNGQGLTAAELPTGVAIGLLVVICVYVSAFAWSWGPLGWLVPSEIQTLETRPAGMAMAVSVNFLFSFVIGQAFLSVSLVWGWGRCWWVLLQGCPVVGAWRGLGGRCCYWGAAATAPADCRLACRMPTHPNPLTHPPTPHPPTHPPPPAAQMMCAMEWGVFLFFAAWILLMTLGVAFFLPETKGVPVESVPALFARHWAWRRVMGPAADEVRPRLCVGGPCGLGCRAGLPGWRGELAGSPTAVHLAALHSLPPAITRPRSPTHTPSHPPPPFAAPQFIQAEDAKSCASVGSKLEGGF